MSVLIKSNTRIKDYTYNVQYSQKDGAEIVATREDSLYSFTAEDELLSIEQYGTYNVVLKYPLVLGSNTYTIQLADRIDVMTSGDFTKDLIEISFNGQYIAMSSYAGSLINYTDASGTTTKLTSFNITEASNTFVNADISLSFQASTITLNETSVSSPYTLTPQEGHKYTVVCTASSKYNGSIAITDATEVS